MDVRTLTTRLGAGARAVDALMGAGESVALAVVGRAATWLAPVAPGIITARAVARVFGLGWGWAVLVACAVEVLGLSTGSLWLRAREWNATKRKTDPSAREGLGLALTAIYFAVDFALIGLLALENWQATGDAGMFVALLFPLLSGVGLLCLNERAAQYRRESDAATAKSERQAEHKPEPRRNTRAAGATRNVEHALPDPEPYTVVGDSTRQAYSLPTRQRAAALLADRPGISGADLGRALGRSDRLGRKLRAELVGGNGNGRHA